MSQSTYNASCSTLNDLGKFELFMLVARTQGFSGVQSQLSLTSQSYGGGALVFSVIHPQKCRE